MLNGVQHWRKMAVDAAKKKAGAAWSSGLLSVDMKEALLCRELVSLMLSVAKSEQEGTDFFNVLRATLMEV